MTHLFLCQELPVPRASRSTDSIELALETSDIVLCERKTKSKDLVRWCCPIQDETAGKVPAVDDMHLTRYKRFSIAECKERSQDDAGLGHVNNSGNTQGGHSLAGEKRALLFYTACHTESSKEGTYYAPAAIRHI